MEQWQPKTIVLGYDGTDGSERAADLAASLALKYGAKVIIATAFKPYPRLIEATDANALEIERARETAGNKAAQLAQAGIETQADDLEGPAQDAILRCAETWKADVIVVGSRGRGPLAGLLLGSVSLHVVHHAEVPVLIAR